MRRVHQLSGIALCLVMVWLGFIWAIPTFGILGIAWTALMAVILLVNLYRFLRRWSGPP